MKPTFRILSASGPRDTDREGIVGHIAVAWTPAPFDEITLQRMEQATDKDGNPETHEDGRKKWTQRRVGDIEFQGAAVVKITDAPIREFQDRDGNVQHFLAVDGLRLPKDVAAAIVAEAVPLIAQAAKQERHAAAGAVVPSISNQGNDGGDDDIPFE